MIHHRDSSSESSLDSPVPIRRVTPRYEIISEMPSYSSEETYSPASSSYTGSVISSIGNDSPIRRNVPRAVVVNDIEAQAEAFPIFDEDESIWSNISSYYNLDEENKPFFVRYVMVIIWFSYLIGVLSMRNPHFLKVAPANENLYLKIVSLYPNCKDQRGQIWRFFSSAIVHADIGHIFLNTLFLYPFIYLIESAHGFKKTAFILSMICIYSGIIFTYFNPYSTVVGCSNLVFGFNGSILADLLTNYHNMDGSYRFLCLFLVIFTSMLEIISYTLLFNDRIAYESHWSSWIIGLLFGLIIFTDRITKKFNLKFVFIAGNLLSYVTVFFLYSYITNWPPEAHHVFTSSEYRFCCEEILFKNVSFENKSCYI